MSPSVQSPGWHHWSLCLVLCKGSTAPVCGLLPGTPATTACSFQTELPVLSIFLNNPSCHLASSWCVFIYGLRYSFSHCTCRVVFFELAWAVEIGAAESPTKTVISLPVSSVSCIAGWKALESVCFCGTQSPWGFSDWESIVALAGVLLLGTPTPCREEEWCPLSSAFWTLQALS